MISREDFIQIRVAEGFTVEQAKAEYDKISNPLLDETQKQAGDTRGDMMLRIAEAKQKNPDRGEKYTPNFKLSEAYLSLKAELEVVKTTKPYDPGKAQEISRKMLSVAISGTITVEQIQSAIDKSLEMPLKQLLAEYSKYKNVVADCESKIEAFDVSAVQAKVDEVTAEYSKKIDRASSYDRARLKAEYNQKVDALEFELITKPLNDLALKRYEAREYMFICEAKLKDYVNANRELIAEEIKQAKREEIRGSLLGLADFIEEA